MEFGLFCWDPRGREKAHSLRGSRWGSFFSVRETLVDRPVIGQVSRKFGYNIKYLGFFADIRRILSPQNIKHG